MSDDVPEVKVICDRGSWHLRKSRTGKPRRHYEAIARFVKDGGPVGGWTPVPLREGARDSDVDREVKRLRRARVASRSLAAPSGEKRRPVVEIHPCPCGWPIGVEYDAATLGSLLDAAVTADRQTLAVDDIQTARSGEQLVAWDPRSTAAVQSLKRSGGNNPLSFAPKSLNDLRHYFIPLPQEGLFVIHDDFEFHRRNGAHVSVIREPSRSKRLSSKPNFACPCRKRFWCETRSSTEHVEAARQILATGRHAVTVDEFEAVLREVARAH